jgi:uncharacterized protein
MIDGARVLRGTPMKILLADILAVPTELDYAAPVDQLNAALHHGGREEYEFAPPLDVHVSFYRAQLDLFFDGHVSGTATATCARCLEPVPLEVQQDFSIILTPETRLKGEIELAPGDLTQSFYSGVEVDLNPLVYEQVLLALPTRSLCAEECRGLCPHCGANLNNGQCACTEETGDPRLAVLRSLKIDRGS